jgi:hypothetical protein
MMTDNQRKKFELCGKYHTCSANTCPLYDAVEATHFIPGDKRCVKIIDYLDNTPMPEDLRAAIAESEPRWRAVLGDALLTRWVDARIKARAFFHKAT